MPTRKKDSTSFHMVACHSSDLVGSSVPCPGDRTEDLV